MAPRSFRLHKYIAEVDVRLSFEVLALNEEEAKARVITADIKSDNYLKTLKGVGFPEEVTVKQIHDDRYPMK